MFLFKINFKIDKLFQLSESSMNTVFQLKEKEILAIFSWFRFYWIKSNTFNCQVTFGPYLFIYFLTFRFSVLTFPVFWISTSYSQYSLYNICKS